MKLPHALLLLVLSLAVGGTAIGADGYGVISAMDDPAEWEGTLVPQAVTDADGRTCLLFDLGQGGQFSWTLTTFPENSLDLDSYDVLAFDFRVEGGGVNISTDIRKWPFLGGYLGLYYQIDDIYRPKEWVTDVAGMHASENNWAGTYRRDEPTFILNVNGAADAGQTLRLYMDNIRVIRYPVKVDCIADLYQHWGTCEELPDGGVRYTYDLILRNQSDEAVPVELVADESTLTHFSAELAQASMTIDPKEPSTATVTLTLPAAAREGLPPAWSERVRLRVIPNGAPELAFALDLLATVPHATPQHPYLFATGEQFARAKERRGKWGWAKSASDWYIKRADHALTLPTELPAYEPREEQPGDRQCTVCGDKTELHEVTTPEAIWRYQCLTCGKMLSPRLEPGAEGGWRYQESGYWWTAGGNDKAPRPGHTISFNRGGNILDLAVAWRLTGERKYLDKAAEALGNYARVLPTYPYAFAPGALQFTRFNTKGSYKVGNYFSQCGWLHQMAASLDLIWDSGALASTDRDALLAELQAMAVNRFRMINTGHHRINEAGLAVGLLSGDANMLGYVLRDPRMGALPALQATMLPDGLNYMAGQYMEPVMMAWMPVLQTYRNAGIDLTEPVPGLRRYAVAIQQWLNPDGLSPSLGDARASVSLRLEDHMELSYAWYGDLDSINGVQRRMFREWQESRWLTPWESIGRQGGNAVLAKGYVLFAGVDNIPRGNPPPFTGSYNFPDYGLLVFNQGTGDRQLWAALPYGPQLGHGHHDNLHLEWWALGQTMSQKQGSRGRHHAVHENTLLVDGRDQFKIPCELREFVDEGPVQGAVLYSTALYPGVAITRTVMLYDGLIFLFDLFDSATAHDYDMVYSNAGTLHSSLAFEPLDRPLGTETNSQGNPTGYASLQDPASAVPPEWLHVEWDNLAKPDARMRLTQLAVGDPGVLLRVNAPHVVSDWKGMTGDIDAAGYTRLELNRTQPEDRSDFMAPKLIRRIHAKSGALLTILEPYTGHAPRLRDFEQLPLLVDGAPTGRGIAVRYVEQNGQRHQVIICPDTGTKVAGEWTSSQPFTAGAFGPLVLERH